MRVRALKGVPAAPDFFTTALPSSKWDQVLTNALVVTGLANFRVVGYPEANDTLPKDSRTCFEISAVVR